MKTLFIFLAAYGLAYWQFSPVKPAEPKTKTVAVSYEQLIAVKAELSAQVSRLQQDVAQCEHNRNATHQEVLRLSREMYLKDNPPKSADLAKNTVDK